VESWASAGAPTGRGFAVSRIAQGDIWPVAERIRQSVQAAWKAAINGISMQFYAFIKIRG
jgi:hypothetical protein